MNLVLTNIYIFVLASVLAILEIQIEGANGWAKNLPTWRPRPGHPLAKIYSKIMGGKELTGYHATLFPFIILIFHLAYLLGTPFTLENELRVLALYFIFIALEDFLWFVLNPFHPLKTFVKQNVHHKAFFLRLPVEYYYAITTSLALSLAGEYIFGISGFVNWWILNFGLFILETMLTILFTLYVLGIDNWVEK